MEKNRRFLHFLVESCGAVLIFRKRKCVTIDLEERTIFFQELTEKKRFGRSETMEALQFSVIQNKAERANPVIRQIPIDKIRANPYQDRKFFHLGKLEELARSIEEHGLLEPITVRKRKGGYYELVSGERRLRACEMAGLLVIPAVVIQVNDQESALLAFSENLTHQPLNFLEEAEACRNLMEDHDLTEAETAERLGCSPIYFTERLRLLRLGEDILRKLVRYGFTAEHAKALLRLTEPQREEVLDEMIAKRMDAEQTDAVVSAMLAEETEKKEHRGRREKCVLGDFRLCTNTIKQSVELIRKNGIPVEYKDRQRNGSYEIHITIRKKKSKDTVSKLEPVKE